MTDGKAHTVLRKKAEAGFVRQDNFAMSPEKALRQALVKTAQDQMAMALSVPTITESAPSLAELPEALEPMALLAILEGPREALGLIAVSQELLAGLTEMQTMGQFGKSPVVPRKPTRTDAAITAGFIDSVLQNLEEMLAEEPDIVWAGGFRYASWMEDPRPLGLILEETTYRMFQITVSLGEAGGRSGMLMLAVPAKGRGMVSALAAAKAEAAQCEAVSGPEAAAALKWQADLGRTILPAEVEINVVLHRVKMSIADVLGLAPGAVLAIPDGALEALSLVGLDGREVGSGRLGQLAGHRAVRLDVLANANAEERGRKRSGFAAGEPPFGRPVINTEALGFGEAGALEARASIEIAMDQPQAMAMETALVEAGDAVARPGEGEGVLKELEMAPMAPMKMANAS